MAFWNTRKLRREKNDFLEHQKASPGKKLPFWNTRKLRREKNRHSGTPESFTGKKNSILEHQKASPEKKIAFWNTRKLRRQKNRHSGTPESFTGKKTGFLEHQKAHRIKKPGFSCHGTCPLPSWYVSSRNIPSLSAYASEGSRFLLRFTRRQFSLRFVQGTGKSPLCLLCLSKRILQHPAQGRARVGRYGPLHRPQFRKQVQGIDLVHPGDACPGRPG